MFGNRYGGFRDAARAYGIEVDSVAAELVRNGVAPYDAIGRAGEIVRERRQRAAEEIAREAARQAAPVVRPSRRPKA